MARYDPLLFRKQIAVKQDKRLYYHKIPALEHGDRLLTAARRTMIWKACPSHLSRI